MTGAQQVCAVSMSRSQNALLDLQAAAIQALDYADFWKIFGRLLGRFRADSGTDTKVQEVTSQKNEIGCYIRRIQNLIKIGFL